MLEKFRMKAAYWLASEPIRKGVNLLNQAFLGYLQNGQVQWLFGDAQKIVKSGYIDNEIVYSVVNVILRKAKVAPIVANRITDKKKYSKYTQYKSYNDDFARVTARVEKRKALDEVENHELLDLLDKPNNYQSGVEFLEAAFGFRKLLGETFIWGMRIGEDSSNAGKYAELHVLPSHLVEIVWSGDMNDPIKGYKFSIGDYSVMLEKEDVLHWKSWNPNWDMSGSHLRGLSPLTPGRKTLTRNNTNIELQTKGFQNGGRVTLLSKEGDGKLPTEILSAVQAKIEEWMIPDNNRATIATNGSLKATPIGDTPADLQMIEAYNADRAAIAALFGVDPILLGDKSRSSYNNQEQAYKALVTNVVVPDLNELAMKLTNWLCPLYDGVDVLEFDTSIYPELQPDLKLMKDVFGDTWQVTGNEFRWAIGWDSDPDPNMDKHVIGAGKMFLEQLSMDADFDNAQNDGDYGNGGTS